MRCIWAFLFMLMSPLSAHAQVVPVVSGEHDGYTRLVFTVAPDREWNLVTEQGVATLVFPAQNMEFVDDEVFTRIPKTRLVSTRAEQTEQSASYRMTLGCDCEVGAFAYLDAYVVVDITDPAEAVTAPPPARHFVPVLSAATRMGANDKPPESVSWITPRRPHYVTSPHGANFPAQTGGVGLTSIQKPDAPPRASYTDVKAAGASESNKDLHEAVDVARNSLLHQLTLAADQGLLDLNGPIPEILKTTTTVQEVAPEVPVEVLEEVEDETQVFIQTAISRDALAAQGGATSQSDHCPSSENLEIASWGSGEDFFEELSSARQGLLREFDEPDFTQVERLVRIYLRYGFGAEARSYLLENGQNLAQHMLLLDLAAIVDGHSIQVGGPLSQAVGCDGVAGLWALVGTYPDADIPIGDEATIVAAFAELPPDIRRSVGPRLASAFLDRGHEMVARQVSDILERAPGNHGAAHELVAENISEVEGSAPEAGQAYQALAEDNSLVATDALIELAKLGLQDPAPPRQHLVMDLAASANVWRGTQKGGELRRLEALWLAKLGKEADAIDLLVSEIQFDPVNAGILRETAERIISALSTSQNLKSSYAEIIQTYAALISENEDADMLRIEIAAGLLTAGLPDYAIEILQPALKRDSSDAALLAGKANIHAYRPDAALSILDGFAGDEARALRVEAYLKLEEFENALEQLSQFTGAPDITVEPHWFSGDWAIAITSNSAAAVIKERFFPDNTDMAPRLDGFSFGEPLSLLATEDILAKSHATSVELENVLLQQ